VNKNNTKVALAAQAIASDTTTVGEIIDLQDVEMVDFVGLFGDFTDGTYAFLIEHGDESNLSDAAAVDPVNQIRGNLYNTAIVPVDKQVVRFQLLKFKRFARLSVISASTTSGTLLAASAELSMLRGSLDNDTNVTA